MMKPELTKKDIEQHKKDVLCIVTEEQTRHNKFVGFTVIEEGKLLRRFAKTFGEED